MDTAVAMRLSEMCLKHSSVLRKVKIFLTPSAQADVHKNYAKPSAMNIKSVPIEGSGNKKPVL